MSTKIFHQRIGTSARECNPFANMMFRTDKVQGHTARHVRWSVPESGCVFLPVEIFSSTINQQTDDITIGTAGPVSAAPLAHRVDITLSHGQRVIVEGPGELSSVGHPRCGTVSFSADLKSSALNCTMCTRRDKRRVHSQPQKRSPIAKHWTEPSTEPKFKF